MLSELFFVIKSIKRLIYCMTILIGLLAVPIEHIYSVILLSLSFYFNPWAFCITNCSLICDAIATATLMLQDLFTHDKLAYSNLLPPNSKAPSCRPKKKQYVLTSNKLKNVGHVVDWTICNKPVRTQIQKYNSLGTKRQSNNMY